MRSTTPLALAAAFFALGTSSVVGAAPERTARAPHPGRLPVLARALPANAPGSSPPPAAKPASWAKGLSPVEVINRNTGARAKVRLYDDEGQLDEEAARLFMRTAASEKGRDEPLPPRLVQLAVRASYHFGGAPIVVVSATRAGARGKHGSGEALDFSLEGVKAGVLASHLFAAPRVGVGLYTHPKTQYVHLDVREKSAHWLDASPPGVTWREKLLADPRQAQRDAAYSADGDRPDVPTRDARVGRL